MVLPAMRSIVGDARRARSPPWRSGFGLRCGAREEFVPQCTRPL